MAYSRAGYTIAKALLIVSLSTPSFAGEVSTGTQHTIVHDNGYRMVYQDKVLYTLSLSGEYPLMHGISIVGGIGYAPSFGVMEEVRAALYIFNLDAGVTYRFPVDFFLTPYVSGKAGLLYGWTIFSDGHAKLEEDAYAAKFEAMAGLDLSIKNFSWGGIGLFFEMGWLEASSLNFSGSGGLDLSGVSSRFGASVTF